MPDAPYFTPDEIRDEYNDLANTTKYPDARIDEVRQRAEEAFEHAAGVAFTPRTATETVDGSYRPLLVLERPKVRAISTVTDNDTGATVDVTRVRATTAGAYNPDRWTAGYQNLTVTYTHGYDTPPLRVKQAVMLLTKEWLIKGPLDDRLTSLTNEDGTFSLLTPGRGGSVFGIPEVDATLDQYRFAVLI